MKSSKKDTTRTSQCLMFDWHLFDLCSAWSFAFFINAIFLPFGFLIRLFVFCLAPLGFLLFEKKTRTFEHEESICLLTYWHVPINFKFYNHKMMNNRTERKRNGKECSWFMLVKSKGGKKALTKFEIRRDTVRVHCPLPWSILNLCNETINA